MVRFDLAGAYLGAWSEPSGPLGVAVHPDGRIFVSRRDDGKVGVYDSGFNFLRFLGDGNPMVNFVKPTDLAMDAAGERVYVVDSGGDRIYAFESDESLGLILGLRGSGSGEFKYPSAIAFDATNNRILVADQENYRVQVFDTDGVRQFQFGYRRQTQLGRRRLRGRAS
ncbi:MAG: NHL repeat-containing protein [Phycisphaerae bacterium]|nr:NHL repeat-containing protein [Phycisphaerae bacterium]